MSTSLSCLGCKSTKFTTQRGLAKHRSECFTFKRLQKRKLIELVLPEEEELPVANDLDFGDFGDVEDVNMEHNIDKLEPLPMVCFPFPLFIYQISQLVIKSRMNLHLHPNNIILQVFL